MKKWLVCAALCLAVLGGLSCEAAERDNVAVLVDGAAVEWTDATPYVNDDQRTMVPLRAAADAMGIRVEWDQARFTAVFTAEYPSRSACPEAYRTEESYADAVSVEFVPQQRSCRVVAESIGYDCTLEMDTSAETADGRIYAPIRYLAEPLGYVVGWDREAWAVTLESPETETDSEPKGNAGPSVALVERPWSGEEFASTLRYMMQNGMTEYTFAFMGGYGCEGGVNYMTSAMGSALEWAYPEVRRDYVEYHCFYSTYALEYTYKNSDNKGFEDLTCTLKLYPRKDLSPAELQERIAAFDAGCDAAIRELLMQDKLREDEDDQEKALDIVLYLSDRLTYDLAYSGAIPSDVLESGKAVCEGYTAVFNALCRRAGLPVKAYGGVAGQSGASGGKHIWNAYEKDGEQYFIDVTWCDLNLEDEDLSLYRHFYNKERHAYYNKDYFWVSWSELAWRDPGRSVDWGM